MLKVTIHWREISTAPGLKTFPQHLFPFPSFFFCVFFSLLFLYLITACKKDGFARLKHIWKSHNGNNRRCYMDGLSFYWIFWVFWIIATFFMKKNISRLKIAAWILVV